MGKGPPEKTRIFLLERWRADLSESRRPAASAVGESGGTRREDGFELADDGRPDFVRVQLGHAVEATAGLAEAGGTPDPGADRRGPRAVGTGQLGAGAGVDADDRRARPRRPGGAGRCRWRSTRSDSWLRAASCGSRVRPQRSRTGMGARWPSRASTSGRSPDEPTAIRPAPMPVRPPSGRSPRNVPGGQRLVSHCAPRLRMIRGLGSPATISAAQRRASSGIGRLKRGPESSAPNARATRSAGRPRACPAAARRRGGCRTIAPPRGHRPSPRAPSPASRRPSAPSARSPCRSIVRSKRARRSRHRSDGHPADPRAVDPAPAAIVDDQLVEVGMAVEQLGERPVHDPGEIGPTAIGRRRAERIGMAWTTSPIELGLMMQTRCGSIVARRSVDRVMGRGLPSPRSSRGHNVNQVAPSSNGGSPRRPRSRENRCR